eukprot:341068-Pyramimonas_sp.AAC.1
MEAQLCSFLLSTSGGRFWAPGQLCALFPRCIFAPRRAIKEAIRGEEPVPGKLRREACAPRATELPSGAAV